MSQSAKALKAMLEENISMRVAADRFGISVQSVSKMKNNPSKKSLIEQEITRLRAENEALRRDAERLKFVTESCWFVRWQIKPGKPKRYQMIHDGEPEGGWYQTAREAIDAAMERKE